MDQDATRQSKIRKIGPGTTQATWAPRALRGKLQQQPAQPGGPSLLEAAARTGPKFKIQPLAATTITAITATTQPPDTLAESAAPAGFIFGTIERAPAPLITEPGTEAVSADSAFDSASSSASAVAVASSASAPSSSPLPSSSSLSSLPSPLPSASPPSTSSSPSSSATSMSSTSTSTSTSTSKFSPPDTTSIPGYSSIPSLVPAPSVTPLWSTTVRIPAAPPAPGTGFLSSAAQAQLSLLSSFHPSQRSFGSLAVASASASAWTQRPGPVSLMSLAALPLSNIPSSIASNIPSNASNVPSSAPSALSSIRSSNFRLGEPQSTDRPPTPPNMPSSPTGGGACLGDADELLPGRDDDESIYADLEDDLTGAGGHIPALMGCRQVDLYSRLDTIEEGTYGVVHRARDNSSGRIVALKKIKLEKVHGGFPITSLREVNILLSIDHPNVVTLHEIVVGKKLFNIFLVMEYMEHDLKHLMKSMSAPFKQAEVKCLLRQLLQGVEALHERWVLHRDLKTSNLLLNNKGVLKICDFGLARKYGSPIAEYTQVVVTLWYRAPELLLGATKYTTAVDMWSVGCIFAELIAKEALFPGKGEFDQLNQLFSMLGTPTEENWPGYSELPHAKTFKWAPQPECKLRQKFPPPPPARTEYPKESGQPKESEQSKQNEEPKENGEPKETKHLNENEQPKGSELEEERTESGNKTKSPGEENKKASVPDAGQAGPNGGTVAEIDKKANGVDEQVINDETSEHNKPDGTKQSNENSEVNVKGTKGRDPEDPRGAPGFLSDLGYDLLRRLLCYDPKTRITATEALEHPYFREAPLPVDPAGFPSYPARHELKTQAKLSAESNGINGASGANKEPLAYSDFLSAVFGDEKDDPEESP